MKNKPRIGLQKTLKKCKKCSYIGPYDNPSAFCPECKYIFELEESQAQVILEALEYTNNLLNSMPRRRDFDLYVDEATGRALRALAILRGEDD